MEEPKINHLIEYLNRLATAPTLEEPNRSSFKYPKQKPIIPEPEPTIKQEKPIQKEEEYYGENEYTNE